MNPYAIPALISAIYLLTLGIISIFFQRKEKINIVFALFSFALSLSAAATFMFYLSPELISATRWMKLPFIFSVPVPIFAFFYVLTITGTHQLKNKKHPSLPMRIFIALIILYGIGIEALTLFTNFIISGVTQYKSTGVEFNYGFLFLPAGIGLSAITISAILMLFNAYKTTEDKSWRENMLYNLFGFSSLYFLAGIMRMYLPYWGVHTTSISFIPLTMSAFIFYLSILRYQFRKIEDLNLNLEKKVAARTQELRQAQANLVQSAKMSALGKLVAGVAHEMNTPLGVISSNYDSFARAIHKLMDEIEIKKTHQPNIEKIFDVIENLLAVNKMSTQQIAKIVKSMKKFARLDEGDIVRADLNESIDDTLMLFNRELKNRIRIEKDYGDISLIHCRANQINQVIMNLLSNAIEAIETEGMIKIRTGQNDDFVWIEISDTGKGIHPDDLDSIFDPGFTTKGVGVGTGLGLAISYQIIQEHRGKISVKSEPGIGSTFTIELPTSDLAAESSTTYF
ncbi:GHKL domain-containing protein [candidate division KSB1 bacterium]|nr:GHKL domain-containing protein [candidate division KSB1 bacterium]